MISNLAALIRAHTNTHTTNKTTHHMWLKVLKWGQSLYNRSVTRVSEQVFSSANVINEELVTYLGS